MSQKKLSWCLVNLMSQNFVKFLGRLYTQDFSLPLQLNWNFTRFSFSLFICKYLLVLVNWNHYSIYSVDLNSKLSIIFPMFIEFEIEITAYSAVFEICWHNRFSFACFGAKCFRTIRYRSRVNRPQNWYDNGPDPCEQSTFPFQKSDRFDNGMVSFPCERSLR